ncbi:MAG: VWA domain-containing protein [Pyrinomonadaceae bacterium]
MKRSAAAVLSIGMLGIAVFGQTRPRVAVTPTPTIERETSGDAADPSVNTPKVPSETGDGEVVKIETNLVTMPVSIIDRNGRFVAGLHKEDFTIFENGIQQEVDYFQSVETPFTVILLIDVSPSTQWQMEDIHHAAITFVDQLRTDDKVMVATFDDDFNVLTAPTNNRAELRSAIREARWGDGTSLYEAVDQVISRELSQIDGRKAVVIFTDGVDTTSRSASYSGTLRDVEEAEAMFYPIRYDTSRDMNGSGGGSGYPGSRKPQGVGIGNVIGIILGGGSWPVPIGGTAGTSRSEYDVGKQYLETLAQNSGGRKYEADSLQNLDSAFAGIAEELRRQYYLGYYPDSIGRPGDRKQIRIRVNRPDLVVRAKTSYVVGQSDRKFAGN